MRVLLWSEYFWPYIGGAEVLARKMLPALQERGHEFMVLTGYDGAEHLASESEYDGIPVHRFPFRAALIEPNLELLLQIRRRITRLQQGFEPDLIHAYLLGSNAALLQHTGRVRSAPVLVTLHHSYRDVGEDTLLRSTLCSADWVVACSAAVLRETRAQLPEITGCSSVIVNSVERPAARPEPMPFEPPNVLCLGRLIPEKGIDLALVAFAKVIDRFPTARLTVAGDGVDRAQLQELAADLGVSGSVDFVGWVEPDQVPAFMNSSTLMLMPSRWEGLPLVALQAAHMARPTVGTRVDGLQEIVVQGETGLLVEREDAEALAEAITFLLDHPKKATQMGGAARRRALEVYSWDRYLDDYDALYRKLGDQ
jgi:glycogen synthase